MQPDKLKNIRQTLKLSLQEMADLVDYSKSNYVHLEKGDHNSRKDINKPIKKALIKKIIELQKILQNIS